MATEIEIFHIGEVILADLLGELAGRGELRIPCVAHPQCTLEGVFAAAGVHGKLEFQSNVSLLPVADRQTNLLFDGTHCVDLLAYSEAGVAAVAFEAKLGLERLSRSEFEKRFLLELSASPKARRIKGSMVAILSHRCVDGVDVLRLRAALEPPREIAQPWVLVVRRATWTRWSRPNDSPPELGPDAHVVCFDDVAAAHGDARAFDALVRRAVGDGFAEAWELNFDRGDGSESA